MKRFRLIEETSTQFSPGQKDDKGNDLWEADRVDYIALIRQVLRAPLQGMPWLEDAEKSVRVLHVLDDLKLGDVLELEDADHAHLCEKVRSARWTVVDERLVRFSHTILNATEDVWPDAADHSYRDPAGNNHHNGVAESDTVRVDSNGSRV